MHCSESNHPNADTPPSKANSHKQNKDHVVHLQRRMDIWLDGDIQSLLDEGNCIQMQLCRSSSPLNNDNNSRILRDLMLQGKVQAVLILAQNISPLQEPPVKLGSCKAGADYGHVRTPGPAVEL